MLSFAQIIEAAGNPARAQGLDSDLRFGGAAALSLAGKSLRKGFVYLGRSSEMDASLNAAGCGFLLADDAHLDMGRICAPCALFPADVDFAQLFGKVQEMLEPIAALRQNACVMLAELSKRGSLDDIVRLASEMLGNSVLLPDPSGRLIAMRSIGEILDPASKDMMTLGYVKGSFVMEMRSNKLDAKILESPDPVLLDSGPFKNLRRIVKKIEIHGKLAAYILVLETGRPFQEQDFDTVSMACGAISIALELQRNYASRSRDFHENLMTDILNGPEIADLAAKESDRRWTLDGPFIAAAVRVPADCSDARQYLEYLRMRFKNLLSDCKISQKGEELVLLLSANESKLYSSKALILELLEEVSLVAGISQKFKSISDLKKACRQAERAIELGLLLGRKQALHEYDGCYAYDMASLAGKSADLRDFRHKGLERLESHDLANGTDYCNTLHMYLKNALSKQRTASALYIHRNTMEHRLRKISDITGCSLADGEVCLELFLAFKVHELQR
jgi:sugar diacid utilization regulator